MDCAVERVHQQRFDRAVAELLAQLLSAVLACLLLYWLEIYFHISREARLQSIAFRSGGGALAWPRAVLFCSGLPMGRWLGDGCILCDGGAGSICLQGGANAADSEFSRILCDRDF